MPSFLRRLAGEFSNKPPVVLFSIFLLILAFSLLLLGSVIDHSEFANPDFKNWNNIIERLSHQKLELTVDRVDGLMVPTNVMVNKTKVPVLNVSLPLTFTVRNCCRSASIRQLFQYKAVKTILPMALLDDRLISEFPYLNFTITVYLGEVNKNLSDGNGLEFKSCAVLTVPATWLSSSRSYADSTFCRVFPANFSIFGIPDAGLDCKHNNCTDYYSYLGNIQHYYNEQLTVWVPKEVRNVIFIRLQYCSYVALIVAVGFIFLAGFFGRPKPQVLLSSSFVEIVDSDEDGTHSY